jgi:hypothetical protein
MMCHLIHIGYPKTGSTFLQHWFDGHPQIGYRKGGFAGFTDIWQLAASAAEHEGDVRCRVTSSETLATPMATRRAVADAGVLQSLAISERRACDLLGTVFPGSSVLIVTRGFRSMILSSYSQYVRTGGHRTLASLVSDAASEQVWHYDRLIRLYRERFGAGRVIVLPFELLRDDTARFLQTLEARLDLDPAPFAPMRVNEALSPFELAWYPRLATIAQRISPRLSSTLQRLSFTNRLRRPIGLLQRLRPLQPIDAALIDDAILAPYRGCATALRDLPAYAPYAAEYLI